MVALLLQGDNLSLCEIHILAHGECAVIAHRSKDDVAVLHKEAAAVAIL